MFTSHAAYNNHVGGCQLRKERFNNRKERNGGDNKIRVGPEFEDPTDIYTTAKEVSHVNDRGVATYHLTLLELTGCHDPYKDIRRRQRKERPEQKRLREEKEIAKFGLVRPNAKLGLINGSKQRKSARKAPDLLQPERELEGRDFVDYFEGLNTKSEAGCVAKHAHEKENSRPEHQSTSLSSKERQQQLADAVKSLHWAIDHPST